MFTVEDIAALKRAIATGATSVRYADGSEVRYRSLSDMRETLRVIEAEVASPAAGSTSRSSVASF